MATKIVNCFRGAKLVGSFNVVVGRAYSLSEVQEPDGAFVEQAKQRLVEAGLAQSPFQDMNFVVRSRH